MNRLWVAFVAVIVVSFLVLGWIGTRIYQEMPPIPEKVVTTGGQTVVDTSDISAGQNVWQSLGGMEVGSVWGHGSYVAPDWTADWLHREAVFILDSWANADFGNEFDNLDEEQQAQLTARLTKLLRTNTYNASTNTVTIDPVRAEAFRANLSHYSDVFTNGKTDYAIPAGAVTDSDRLHNLSAYARSGEFMQTDLMQTLRWMRVPGDTVFFLGAVGLVVLSQG